MTDHVDPETGTGIDTSVPHSARIWNYWLGGKDHYAVDREAGDVWTAVNPEIVVMARQSRAFLRRVVEYLARDAGIRQFLDVGTGLPTADNTHEVAQRVAPDARVVYVDNDPLVLAHARALLTGTPDGLTRYLHADMNDRDALLAGASDVLDLDRPVAVFFMGVLGHVRDIADARGLVRGLMERVPAGSHLASCDGTLPQQSPAREQALAAQESYADSGAVPYRNRDPAELETLYDGLELVEPGFGMVSRWRPDGPRPEPVDQYGAVARKT